MNLYPIIAVILAGLSLVAITAALGLLLALALPGGRAWLRRTLGGLERHPIGWAWFVALVATAGSLYLSDIVGFVPCLFCWYQRIAMYPLVLVLGVALLRADPDVWRYALPLATVGFVIATYHVLLQYRPSLELIACESGVPCSARYMAVFGFVSIPLMAGAAFLLVLSLLLVVRILSGKSEAAAEQGYLALPNGPPGPGVTAR